MASQIAVRLPARLLEEIDALVDSGSFDSRGDVIVAGVEQVVDGERRRRIGESIVRGYERVPQAVRRDEELGTYPSL